MAGGGTRGGRVARPAGRGGRGDGPQGVLPTTARKAATGEAPTAANGWKQLRTDLYLQAQGILAPDNQSYTGHYWYQTTLDLKAVLQDQSITYLIPKHSSKMVKPELLDKFLGLQAVDFVDLPAFLAKDGADDRLLSDFTDKDRTFVELYYQKGLEADEIAAEMQISLKTVYSKKHKIRAHLVRCLQNIAGDSPIADLAAAAA